MVLIDALRPGGRYPGLLEALGVVIGFAGIVLLVGPSQWSGTAQGVDPLGALALLLGALLWSFGSLYSREAPLPDSALLGTSMEMLAGGAGLLLAATLSGEWARLDLAAISARSLWGLAYLIVFGSLVAFVAYTWLLRVAPTPLVATYAYVNPLIAIFLGSLLAQEALTARILVPAIIIVASIAMINAGRNAARKQPAGPVASLVSGED
jgi:drug/metabolite transporter (DMT)-like permease